MAFINESIHTSVFFKGIIFGRNSAILATVHSQLEQSAAKIRAREKDQYLAAKIKMEKQIWIFAFLATFIKGN